MRTFRSIFRLPAACPIFSPGHQVARLFRRRYRTVQWNFAARKRTPGSVGTMLVRARGVTVRVMRFVGPFWQSRLGLRAETGADGCGTIFEIPYGERYRKHRFYASLLILDSFVGAADGSANGTEHETAYTGRKKGDRRQGHRAALLRQVLRPQRAGRLPLPAVRRAALPLCGQVRFGLRLAQFR